jgi:hypothetical protein
MTLTQILSVAWDTSLNPVNAWFNMQYTIHPFSSLAMAGNQEGLRSTESGRTFPKWKAVSNLVDRLFPAPI